ncbi:MAG: hypothetical protein HKM89_15165 [Gemmatimonadales bacterium]|nr:hypothetical protein [Gemmatimonadales bacterium]
MHLRLSLPAVALAAGLAVSPVVLHAQDEAPPPEIHYMTVAKFSAPYSDAGQKVMWWIDSVMVPSAKMNPHVLSTRVGTHIYGSSGGDIVMMTEYADWNAINADCEPCDAWFEERQPEEGTPEREAWDEAQAAFFKYFTGHQDEIYSVNMNRAK